MAKQQWMNGFLEGLVWLAGHEEFVSDIGERAFCDERAKEIMEEYKEEIEMLYAPEPTKAAKAGPKFKLGDKVLCRIYPDGGVGTIVRAPKKISKRGSVLFDGVYAYDVDFSGRVQRLAESHLEIVKVSGAAR